MTNKLNLSGDPTKVVLDPKKKYRSSEIREVLEARANAVYTTEDGKAGKANKKI